MKMNSFIFMKLFIYSVTALLSLLFFSACSTPSTVDYDRTLLVQMRNYESYSIVPREERSAGQHLSLTEIVDRRVVQAIHQSLQERGLRPDENSPDCRIAFFTTTEKRTEMQDLGLAGGYYRHGWKSGGWSSYAPVSIDEYEEGTLILDVIDTQSGQLAWRGATSRRLGHSAPNEGEVQTAVSQILTEFPPAND
jgi:hypothetical protein